MRAGAAGPEPEVACIAGWPVRLSIPAAGAGLGLSAGKSDDTELPVGTEAGAVAD